MIRFLLRFLGLMLLALAFIFVIYDGMKSIADHAFYATTISQFWTELHGASLQAAQGMVERVSAALWNMAIAPLLGQPAALVFAALGVLLIVLGRRKKPLIGYARD
jgi:ABC-type phosphate transport system permease subunit